ncbi:MAG: sigma 54-interacting transcriptional regulator [Planctomycetota bacterium]
MSLLPRALIIDDEYGRGCIAGLNLDREACLSRFRFSDVTDDKQYAKFGLAIRPDSDERVEIRAPVAEAVFCRGQTPAIASVGDEIVDDLEGVLNLIRAGWTNLKSTDRRWSIVFLDLTFLTGTVTEASNKKQTGMPAAQDKDQVEYIESWFGLRLLEAIRKEFPELPVVMLSGNPRNMVSDMFSAKGANGFISKTQQDHAEQLAYFLNFEALVPDPSGSIVGNSLATMLMLKQARKAMLTDEPVLIRGETGTGKNLLFKYMVQFSNRAEVTPQTVAGGNFTDSLGEDRLFGHEAGAYTDAKSTQKGAYELANKGTLFLDEIGRLSLSAQARLLNVLQEKWVKRQGGHHTIEVDVKSVFATSQPIENTPQKFMPDLYSRIVRGGLVYVPPLRERLEDIPALAEKILKTTVSKITGALVKGFLPEAVAKLKNYQWPGNIRELETVVSAAVRANPRVEKIRAEEVHLENFAVGSVQRNAHGHEPAPVDSPLQSRISVTQLLDFLNSSEIYMEKTEDLRGLLASGRQAAQRFDLAVSNAALQLICLAVEDSDKREGLTNFEAAIQLLTGDQSIGTTQFYRLVDKHCGQSPSSPAGIQIRNIIAEKKKLEATKRKSKK